MGTVTRNILDMDHYGLTSLQRVKVDMFAYVHFP